MRLGGERRMIKLRWKDRLNWDNIIVFIIAGLIVVIFIMPFITITMDGVKIFG